MKETGSVIFFTFINGYNFKINIFQGRLKNLKNTK
jgi:hypothetical protein